MVSCSALLEPSLAFDTDSCLTCSGARGFELRLVRVGRKLLVVVCARKQSLSPHSRVAISAQAGKDSCETIQGRLSTCFIEDLARTSEKLTLSKRYLLLPFHRVSVEMQVVRAQSLRRATRLERVLPSRLVRSSLSRSYSSLLSLPQPTTCHHEPTTSIRLLLFLPGKQHDAT